MHLDLLHVAMMKENGQQERNRRTSVGESVNYKITGIDPGAGIMEATEKAIEEYELTDWDLVSGSGAAMTAALKKAYDKEDPIIVTGWTPHWKFAEYDLKYLEDPKGVYGGEEQIHSIGRIGLAEDLPEAHQILSNFNWSEEDMGEVMIAIQEGEKEEVLHRTGLMQMKKKLQSGQKA